MDLLEQLLSLENVMLCLAIVALVWVQRKVFAVIYDKASKGKKLEDYKLYRDLFVPCGPLGTGGLLMLVPQLPVPEMFNGGLPARMVFGVALGLLSGFVYKLVKKNLLDKLGGNSSE